LGTEKAKLLSIILKIQGYTNAESQQPFSMFKYIVYNIKNNVIYWIPYGDPNLGKRSVVRKKQYRLDNLI